MERAINLGMKRGPIRNIHVEGLFPESVYTFVRILSRDQPIENIRIRRVTGGVRRFAVNMTRWRFPAGCGNIRNVLIADFNVRKIATQYLDDPTLREGGLIRNGDALGYEIPGGRRMPHISTAAHVSYLAEPLLAVGLSVSNLVIENFRRAPDEAATSRTFVLANGCVNSIELTTGSREQARRIVADSRGLDASVLRFAGPDGAERYRLTGVTTPDAVVSVAQGSVDSLRLNAT